MNTGEHAWRIPNGETGARVKNDPALAGGRLYIVLSVASPEVAAEHVALALPE